jgi:type IV pilus assembly protein PilA
MADRDLAVTGPHTGSTKEDHMLHKLRHRAEDEKGFTLIELLVVILIIGILAAIALPTFLGQTKKGQDSSAKSDARNAVSQVESCFTDNETYVGCPTTATPHTTVTPNGTTGYAVVATSKSGNTFTITKTGTTTTRTCTTGGDGGCKSAADSDGNYW